MPTLEDLTFARVSDFYLAELRKGTAQPIDQYAEAFPHLAAEIYEHFPTMSVLELSREQAPDASGVRQQGMLGGCKIEAELGRGSMGTVLLGYQEGLDRRVALKVMTLANPDLPMARDRFEKECRAMARLDHPNIVPVYEHGYDGSQSYFIMKLIEGRSLDQLLSRDPDYRSQALLCELRGDWRRFGEIAAQIADALHHAHERGIVHRDIKPGNLLLDESGKPWVTDFGIAKLQEQQQYTATRTGALVGTPRYMAPEQFRGVCDRRTDIYALGLTLYDLALGKPATVVAESNPGDATIDTGGIPPLCEVDPSIPSELSEIVARACALSPEERYQSADEFGLVMQRFAGGRSPAERRSTKRLSDGAYANRKRRLGFALGGLLLVSVVIAAFPWLGDWPNSRAGAVATASGNAPFRPSNFLETISSEGPSDSGSVVEALVQEIASPILSEGKQETAPQASKAADNTDTTDLEVRAEKLKAKLDSSVPAEASSKIASAVSATLDGQRLDDLRVRDLVAAYRQTSLPAATRLLNRLGVVQRSALSGPEKQAAGLIIQRYAKAVVNRHIPEREANSTVDVLTGGVAVTTEQLERMDIPDRTLRSWLGMLQHRLRTLPKGIEEEEANVENELRSVLEHAIRRRDREG